MEINFSDRYECPECGSHRGLAYFDNDDSIDAWCFSCQTPFKDPLNGEEPTVIEKEKVRHDSIIQTILSDYPQREISDRGISKSTATYFGIRVGLSEQDGQTISYHYYPREKDNKLIGWHVKVLNPKRFYNLWSTETEYEDGTFKRYRDADMFGTIRARRTGGYKLIVVEGPTDMGTTHELILNSRKGTKNEGKPVAVVSPPDGAGSVVKALAAQRDLVEDFKEIVLCLDMDEPGQEATRKACALMKDWDVDVKVAKLSEKDPGEMYAKGKADELVKAVMFNARFPRPEGALSVEEIIEHGTKEVPKGIPLPWEGPNNRIWGIRDGVTAIASGGGGGKTTALNTIIHHLIDLGRRPGILPFEGSANKNIRMLASPGFKTNLLHPDAVYDKDAYIEYLRDFATKIEIAKPAVRTWTDIHDLILEWVLGSGVDVVILDPITRVQPSNTTEANEWLDSALKQLATSCDIHGFPALMTVHLNKAPKDAVPYDYGGRISSNHFTGSNAFERWCIAMVAIERNKQADDPLRKGVDEMLSDKDVSCWRTLKARDAGDEGKNYLEYDPRTMFLKEI